jgi:hypothetical protein
VLEIYSTLSTLRLYRPKDFFRTKTNKKGDSEEISEMIDNFIRADQIFAEMFDAVCHPEFFEHMDVKALPSQSP